MKRLIQIFGISSLLLLTGCSNSIEEYYFDLKDFTNSKVYKYECKEESSKTQYWKLSSNLQERTLITEAFDNNYNQYEYFKEKITDNGSVLVQFSSFISDENGDIFEAVQTPIKLDVYKWETGSPYKYSVETLDPDFGKITFEKERTYLGKEEIDILGKACQAIKIEGKYRTEVVATNQVFEYSQFSYYVNGFGLVRMEKKYEDGKMETFELTEIISKENWEKR